MSYQGFSDGLYLARTSSHKLGGILHHAGVIDVGNVLKHPNFDERCPILYHQTVSGLVAVRLTGVWRNLQEIVDVEGARERILYAARNPEYHLFENNCEHFANFVATGKKFSGQLRGVGAIALIAGLIWFTYTETQPKRRVQRRT